MKLNRRQFVASCASGLIGGMTFAQPGNWLKQAPRGKDSVPQNSARNLIFIFLAGAPSHVDTFDLKTGTWTPAFLGPANLNFYWPAGLMPLLARRQNQFSVVRSLRAVEAVHERAEYQLTTAHRLNSGTLDQIPHLASLLSFKLDHQRQPHHSLPTVARIGPVMAKNGFLPLVHQGIELDYSGAIPNLFHTIGNTTASFQMLDDILARTPNRGAQGDHRTYLDQVKRMMNDPELEPLMFGTQDNPAGFLRTFETECKAAVRFLAADKGVRVINLTLGNWDHHGFIYNQDTGLPVLAGEFDKGMALLLDQLSGLPSLDGTRTLLDETLIVAVGEFGRTVGPLNSAEGRDHFPAVMSALLAGGGVIGGRAIGVTNALGDAIIDPGWSQNRLMTVYDLVATIYSSLGIDWNERILDTKSGRTFDLVDQSLVGPAFSINTLFV